VLDRGEVNRRPRPVSGRFFKRANRRRGFIGIVTREAPVIPIVPPSRAAGDLASRSDDQLMTLAATGMLVAFGELVTRYERQVRSLCRKMLGDGAPADDVAQDVFLEIWRTCARYQGRGQFRSFLFTTARNRCLNATRRRLPTVPLETTAEAHEAIGAAPDQIEALLAAERRQRLDRLIERLPPKLREAVWLRYGAELEYDEIAAIVDRSTEAVRTRVCHGLRRLRRLMNDRSLP
jgi:RNA polymerase sigma-70 factor (ECF subfamily)